MWPHLQKEGCGWVLSWPFFIPVSERSFAGHGGRPFLWVPSSHPMSFKPRFYVAIQYQGAQRLRPSATRAVLLALTLAPFCHTIKGNSVILF